MADCKQHMDLTGVVSTNLRASEIIEALNPLYFNVDDRTQADFLLYIERLSHFVTYYDVTNTPGGNWSQFFASDKTFILLLINSWNVIQLRSNWNALVNNLDAVASSSEQKKALNQYFESIQKELQSYETRLSQVEENVLSVKENLIDRLPKLHDSIAQILQKIDESSDLNRLVSNPYFNKQVSQLFGLVDSWKELTQAVIQFLLNEYDGHHPHIALMITFLKLLSHAQTQLNSITQQHLDFYYKEVLRMRAKKSKADKVHLIVEHKEKTAFPLPAGTTFPAGKNQSGVIRLYESIADTFIDRVKLTAIHTKHVDDSGVIYRDIAEEINQGNAVSLFNKAGETFGDVLLITSPLLLLNSGKRTVKIKFHAGEERLIEEKIVFRLSLEDKWLKLNEMESDNAGVYTLEIDADEKAVAALNKKVHETEIESQFPALEIHFSNETAVQKITDIQLSVQVDDFKSFEIITEHGSAAVDKAFFPFGVVPQKGNSFVVESTEFALKESANEIITLNFSEGGSIGYKKEKMNPGKANSSFRFELTDNDYSGNKYMNNYILQSKATTPSLPYLPKINSIKFDYTVDFVSLKDEPNSLIYKLNPYGYKPYSGEIPLENKNKTGGEILLGFENAVSGATFQTLFQIQSGTFNPLLNPASVNWEYLNGNDWKTLTKEDLVDETNALLHTGLVTINIPVFERKTNSLLRDNLFWLRVAISDKNAINDIIGIHNQVVTAVHKLTESDDFEESVPAGTIIKSEKYYKVNFKINQPYPSFGGRTKERDSDFENRVSRLLRHKGRAITSNDYARLLLDKFPEIDSVKILNHYRTQSGKAYADAAGYITIVPIAKSQDTKNPLWRPFLPQDRISVYRDYLESITNPHARIKIIQPQLEKVSIECRVKFRTSYQLDKSLMLKELEKHVNQFLSPWAYQDDAIKFVDGMVFSKIIQLIDNFAYVDYLRDFKVHQYVLNNNREEKVIISKDRIDPQTAYTLFVPHEQHKITIIE